jgi:outer membrane lipoprotein SlyB
VAAGTEVSYLDPAAPWGAQVGATAGVTRLKAFLATRVALRYDDTAAGIDEQQEFEALYGPLDGGLDLDAETVVDFDDRDFRPDAPPGATYVLPAAPVAEAKFFTQASRDVQARLVANRGLEIFRNKQLKLSSRPGETQDAFLTRCDEEGQVKADEETAKLKTRLEAKKDRLESALEISKRRVEEIDTQTKSHEATTMIAGAGAVLGALFGGKRNARSIANAVGSVASKAGQTATSSQRRQTAEAKVTQTQDDLTQIEQEIADQVTAIDDKWKTVAEAVETVSIRLEATDVRVTDVRLVWVPVD